MSLVKTYTINTTGSSVNDFITAVDSFFKYLGFKNTITSYNYRYSHDNLPLGIIKFDNSSSRRLVISKKEDVATLYTGATVCTAFSTTINQNRHSFNYIFEKNLLLVYMTTMNVLHLPAFMIWCEDDNMYCTSLDETRLNKIGQIKHDYADNLTIQPTQMVGRTYDDSQSILAPLLWSVPNSNNYNLFSKKIKTCSSSIITNAKELSCFQINHKNYAKFDKNILVEI